MSSTIQSGRFAAAGGGAIAIRGKAALAESGTDDITITSGDFDVAPQAADTLVALLFSWVNAGEGSPPFAPSGWTQRAQTGLSGETYVTAYTRSASGFTASNFQALPGEGPPANGQILHVYAIKDGTGYDVASATVPPGAPGTSLALTQVTTTGPADLLLGFWVGIATSGSPTTAVPGSMTPTLTTGVDLAGNPHAARSGHELLSASGATGTRTGTISGGVSPVLIGGLLVAIK